MFYVIYDHDMVWDDGCDCDKHVAEFTDRAAALSFADDTHGRVRRDDDCVDRWSVRRVMHDDTVIDWTPAG